MPIKPSFRLTASIAAGNHSQLKIELGGRKEAYVEFSSSDTANRIATAINSFDQIMHQLDVAAYQLALYAQPGDKGSTLSVADTRRVIANIKHQLNKTK